MCKLKKNQPVPDRVLPLIIILLLILYIGAWNVYNTQKRNYFEINSGLSGLEYKNGHAARFWNEYLPYLCQEFNGTNFTKGKMVF